MLRYFLAEKRCEVPTTFVDLMTHENMSPDLLALNPARTVPFARLEDGRTVMGTLPVLEYIEDRYPEPPLMGTSRERRAVVRSWMRLADERIVSRGIVVYKLLASTYRGIERQDPAVAAWFFNEIKIELGWFDGVLAHRDYLADGTFSAADIVLLAGVEQVQTLVFTLADRGVEDTEAFRLDVPNTWTRLEAWANRVRARKAYDPAL
jgi:glutathione S-transferase